MTTLPGSLSSYEELLEQVRKLTRDTVVLHEQVMSADLFGDINRNYYSCGIAQKDSENRQRRGDRPASGSDDLTSRLQSRNSNQQSRYSLPVSLKIPPGDLNSRLTAWREMNDRRSRPNSISPQQHQTPAAEAAASVSVASATSRRTDDVDEERCSLQGRHRRGENNDCSKSSLVDDSVIEGERARCVGKVDVMNNVVDCRGEARLQLHQDNVFDTSCDKRNKVHENGHSSSSMQSCALTHFYESWPTKHDPPWSSNTMQNELTDQSHLQSGANMSCLPGMDQNQSRTESKKDKVYSLLSTLGSSSNGNGQEDMSVTLLSMSHSVDSCIIMRQSGCLPILIQLIHAPGQDTEVRERASRALYNIVHAKADEKSSKREIRVLRLLEQLREYCQTLKNSLGMRLEFQDDLERHPSSTIAALMKLSFDETHRIAMCQLGGLYAVTELIEMDHKAHGSDSDDHNCITLRRYAGMALTNLTYGDGNNKALLCSFRDFMIALVSQLQSPSDDLRQVTASVLRNLSWRADSSSKQTLREVGSVVGLMKAAMEGRKESTLKSILSALWNLSAHCRTNKIDICGVEGALAFLVDTLSYNAPSKTLAIVENAGGILRNVSSYIAMKDDYRTIVRERGCLQVLLLQLKSPSLTVVSNACGTLWNLSARNSQDQRLLWDLGAVPMLRNLVHSKHKMISMGSSAALKNLFSACPNPSNFVQVDSTSRILGHPTLPSLMARKQKALEQEIDQNLSETCDNIEPSNSPINKEDQFSFKLDQSFLNAGNPTSHLRTNNTNHQTVTSQAGLGLRLPLNFPRSESKESVRSVTSTQSDTIFEKVHRQARHVSTPTESQIKQQSASVHSTMDFDSVTVATEPSKSLQSYFSIIKNQNSNYLKKLYIPNSAIGLAEKKYTLRYINAIPESLKPGGPLSDLHNLNCTNSTVSWSTTPNQDVACSKGSLNSSIESNSAALNLCDYSSLTPKVFSNSKSSAHNSACSKSASVLNDSVNHNVSSSSNKIIASPINNDSSKDYTLGSQINCSSKHSEQLSSNEEQNSSLYSPCSNLEQFEMKENLTEIGQQNFSNLNLITKNNTLFPSHNNALTSNADSLRSTTASVDSMLTLEVSKSLDSDSAIFEDDRDSGRNSDTSHFSIPLENRCTTNSLEGFKKVTNNTIHHQNIRFDQTQLKKSHDERILENNINQYKKTITKNMKENLKDNSPNLKLVENINDRPLQDDEDFSEVTHNDYYTVQETYTLEKNIGNDSQNTFVNDECSISQQCSSTLSYISADDENSLSDIVEKIKIDSTDVKKDQTTAVITTLNSESCESFNSIERSEQALLELCIKSGRSKAVTLLADEVLTKDKLKSSDTSTHTMFSANDTFASIPQKTEGEATSKSQKQEEYRRQRDPDAMIASLDRLTMTLIQQSEAIMRKESSSTMKASLLSESTWNEEESSNDVSFPSMSISAPLAASFKSDLQDQEVDGQSINQMTLEQLSMDEHTSSALLCSKHNSMTESKIIQMEANKLADAVVGKDANYISLASMNLDEINPPSTMGSLISLTTSISLVENGAAEIFGADKGQPDSLPAMLSSSCGGRKKSLPMGVVARRALSHGQNRTASLENLLNECNNASISQLENVMPPSLMDELLDSGDMENSMLSVASITSEVADGKDSTNYSNSLNNGDINFDLIKPVANVLSLTCMKYADAMQGSGNNSLSECLENINPPSLFNEVNQMDESTTELNTRCSDTLCINVDLDNDRKINLYCALDERIDNIANDTDDAITPISSECCSSVESTPKRHLSKNQPGQLTPKQKRQLGKERYKTYTIEAERMKKEQEELKKQEVAANGNIEENTSKCTSMLRRTPKQRRQEDRARFQTQVLDNSILSNPVSNESSENETSKLEKSSPEKPSVVADSPTPTKSGIPMLRKFGANKTCKIQRNVEQDQQSKDRYRTQTLDLTKINSSDCNNDDSREYEKPLFSNQTFNLNEPISSKNLIRKTESENSGPFSIPNGSELNLTIRETNRNVLNNQNRTTSEPSSPSPDVKDLRRNYVVDVQDDFYVTQNRYSDSDNDDSEDSSQKEDKGEQQKPRGPRIVKPGELRRDLSVESNGTDKSDPEPQPKTIRGRRKPLYSKSSTRCSTPQSSPLKQPAVGTSPAAIPLISRSNSSPVVRATRATTLRQYNSAQKCNGGQVLDKRIQNASSPSQVSSRLRTSIPQKSSVPLTSASVRRQPDYSQKPLELPFKALERQGTFTKDEPEMDNVPTVIPASPYRGRPIAKTSKTGIVTPKTSPVHGRSKISPRVLPTSASKLKKTTSAEKITVGSNIPMLAKRASTNLSSPVAKTSLNYPIGINASDSSVPRKISVGQRSSSNSNIVSNSSNHPNRKVKETASKIATLWKKVEESKNKQQQRYERPDKKQWITPNTRGLTQVHSPCSKNDQTCNLFRSSTFEGITKISKSSARGFISPTA